MASSVKPEKICQGKFKSLWFHLPFKGCIEADDQDQNNICWDSENSKACQKEGWYPLIFCTLKGKPGVWQVLTIILFIHKLIKVLSLPVFSFIKVNSAPSQAWDGASSFYYCHISHPNRCSRGTQDKVLGGSLSLFMGPCGPCGMVYFHVVCFSLYVYSYC